MVGASAVPAGGFALRSRAASGIMPAGTTTGVRGASLELGPALAGKPAAFGAVSHEAWPEAEPWGGRLPLARTVVERRQASAPAAEGRRKPALRGARRARWHGIRTNCVCRRSASLLLSS